MHLMSNTGMCRSPPGPTGKYEAENDLARSSGSGSRPSLMFLFHSPHALDAADTSGTAVGVTPVAVVEAEAEAAAEAGLAARVAAGNRAGVGAGAGGGGGGGGGEEACGVCGACVICGGVVCGMCGA